MARTWIVTADRAGARFIVHGPEGLELVEQSTHPEGQLRDSEIVSDRPGRSFESASHARHAMSQSESPHEHVAHAFARSIADRLEHARNEGCFRELVLAAEPQFLGMLRAALDDVTARCVVSSIPKNLQRVPLRSLETYLTA